MDMYDEPVEAIHHMTDPRGHHNMKPEVLVVRLASCDDDYLSVALSNIHIDMHREMAGDRYIMVTDTTFDPAQYLVVDVELYEVVGRWTANQVDASHRARAFRDKLNRDQEPEDHTEDVLLNHDAMEALG